MTNSKAAPNFPYDHLKCLGFDKLKRYIPKEENMTTPIEIGIVSEVMSEYEKASAKFAPFNSAHEGFAVLAEEVDELWDHVKTNQTKRDIEAMRREAIQIAAMAIRFAVDVCDNKETARK